MSGDYGNVFEQGDRRQITSPIEQIPFSGMTASQVERRMRGLEEDPPPIWRVYLRKRDAPLIVEGATSMDTIGGWTYFQRDDETVVAMLKSDDIVAIYQPEPTKAREA